MGGLAEYALCLLHSSNHQASPDSITIEDLENVHNMYATQWSSGEVEIFCEGVRRHGDHIRRVWLVLEETKTLRETLDFYLRVYPYARRCGVEKFSQIFRRAERAAEGAVLCVVLYCTVLYCTVLYCTVLYCPDLLSILFSHFYYALCHPSLPICSALLLSIPSPDP